VNDGERQRPHAGRALRERAVQLPSAWWAFHQQYYAAYLSYAELQLGDRAEAEDLVHRVFLHLATHWEQLMREKSPPATAWALLKSGVAETLIFLGREPAMAATAAFRKVTRQVLNGFRGELAAMETALGLYTAIARLPERQFDVIVLQFVLGHGSAQTAHIMGVCEATVRTHRRLARRKLARDLALADPEDDGRERQERDDEKG
jgi:DNA-directed RNA polymerase specialized sigma24 family protein